MTAALAAGLLATVGGACSTPPPPPPLVVDADAGDRDRLARVGGALATANVALCRGTVGLVDLPARPGHTAEKRCAITIRLFDRPGIGVAAEGDELWVSAGMLRFVRNDDELATVLAHRLAHLLAAYPKPRRPLLSRIGADVGLGPGPAPEPVFDPASERTADRISLFLLARADIDPAVAVRFWRRLASLPPDSNDWLLRHPVTPARLEAMAGVVAEIKTLRGAQQALVP